MVEKMNLSTLFRHSRDRATQVDANIKEELLERKHEQVESRASAFLVDQKYSLKLDELI